MYLLQVIQPWRGGNQIQQHTSTVNMTTSYKDIRYYVNFLLTAPPSPSLADSPLIAALARSPRLSLCRETDTPSSQTSYLTSASFSSLGLWRLVFFFFPSLSLLSCFLDTHVFQKVRHLGELLLNIRAWNLSCSVFPSCHSRCSNLRSDNLTQNAARRRRRRL